MTTTIDAQAVRNLIGRVIGRTCEPGADHEAYQLADIARRLVADNERLLAEVDRLRDELGHAVDDMMARGFERVADQMDQDAR